MQHDLHAEGSAGLCPSICSTGTRAQPADLRGKEQRETKGTNTMKASKYLEISQFLK